MDVTFLLLLIFMWPSPGIPVKVGHHPYSHLLTTV